DAGRAWPDEPQSRAWRPFVALASCQFPRVRRLLRSALQPRKIGGLAQFVFGTQPIVQVVAVLAAALDIEFVRTTFHVLWQNPGLSSPVTPWTHGHSLHYLFLSTCYRRPPPDVVHAALLDALSSTSTSAGASTRR